MAVLLGKLIDGIACVTSHEGEKISSIPVSSLAYNSKKAAGGSVFFCIVGTVTDGHKYAPDAYKNGCRIFVCERELALPRDAVTITVADSRKALAQMSAAFFGHPEEKLTLIGVTGTKGKTDVASLIGKALCDSGKQAMVISTVGVSFDGEITPTANSTPESYEIYSSLSRAVDGGAGYAVVEASSQGLYLSRLYGLRFKVAVFTNLSKDHIGGIEHPDFEHYKASKKKLFRMCDNAVLNRDDRHYGEFFAACACNTVTYGIKNEADYSASEISQSIINGRFMTEFRLDHPDGSVGCKLSLPGVINVYNALAAAAACAVCGVGINSFARSCSDVSVRGRFEIVDTELKDRLFVIDYAHNGVSLENALKTLRPFVKGRLIAVFGSVGGRTVERRKELAAAAKKYADLSVVTSDNPDFEPPDVIIEDIAAHMGGAVYIKETDRAAAVKKAVGLS
ncbi:MAG: UDP-N-acetylmuramoyl-L-alanyl-D-glutamate--2,6-diaminopimelate ligase, partial [Clostridia bacterium]|nr:UDP-N-acetylmuramoyl-L-alanyl-D-glutamate--2,6-diaminopimelate ligase [Clostridia bacterium]